jgi:hypothetical protein
MYLYVKTHITTGLKYLGKTVRDPYKYKGSGTHWIRHLKKYGEEHTTEVLLETTDKILFKETAIYYSNLFDVVKSIEWANIVPEQGDGGDTSQSPAYQSHIESKNFLYGEKNGFYGKTHSEETKRKISEKNTGRLKGKPKSDETRKRMSENNARNRLGKAPWNKGKSTGPQSPELRRKKGKPLVFNDVEYNSINEAETITGISAYKISKNCIFLTK